MRQSNYHPDILIPLNKNPKILGVTFSSHFTFSPHINNITAKATSHLQLLKATSGQDWGDKETLRLTYNVFVKPVITYTAPLWFPSTKPDSASMARLQRIQNAAMRIITGAHKMSSVDHLLTKTEL